MASDVCLGIRAHPGGERLSLASWGDGFSMRLKRPHMVKQQDVSSLIATIIDKHLQALNIRDPHGIADRCDGLQAFPLSGVVQH